MVEGSMFGVNIRNYFMSKATPDVTEVHDWIINCMPVQVNYGMFILTCIKLKISVHHTNLRQFFNKPIVNVLCSDKITKC